MSNNVMCGALAGMLMVLCPLLVLFNIRRINEFHHQLTHNIKIYLYKLHGWD
jgi:hypothetical protein